MRSFFFNLGQAFLCLPPKRCYKQSNGPQQRNDQTPVHGRHPALGLLGIPVEALSAKGMGQVASLLVGLLIGFLTAAHEEEDAQSYRANGQAGHDGHFFDV